MPQIPADYDLYDYKKYWSGRAYEHESETIAIKQLLKLIKRNNLDILEIGAGFGRLVPIYKHKAKSITLLEPSNKLINIAKKDLSSDQITFIHSDVQQLYSKTKSHFDFIIMVRVLHHIKDPKKVFEIINQRLKPDGYLLLEFANKEHAIATVRSIFQGNLTFRWDIFPIDIRSKKNIRKDSIAFYNFHPDDIYKLIDTTGFKIIQKRSVSNFRNRHIKKLVPLKFLIHLEKALQRQLATHKWGPSVFLLAQKTSSKD